MIRLLAIFILLIHSAIGNASSGYRSGIERCRSLSHTAQYPTEHGFSVTVPVDYEDPTQGFTEIFAWTNKPFQAEKESVVFFAGGPGASTHGSLKLDELAPDFNVIHFDQRGVVCSMPTDPSLLSSAKYFSSTATAQDSEKIRQYLKIKSWSVYGHSYGTVPATIAASLFPKSVNAAVLEGVVFDGSENLWLAPHRLKILQRFFDRLPPTLQVKILTRSEQQPQHWFSAFAQLAMYKNFALRALIEDLENLFALDEASLLQKITDVATEADFSWMMLDAGDTNLMFGKFTFIQIGCRELSAGHEASSWFATFSGRQLRPAKIDLIQSYCRKNGIVNDPKQIFSAVKYPITRPVSYFQGGLDGATEAPSAVRHYKQVAKGPAQLLIAPQGGHSGIQLASREPRFIQEVLRSALRGQEISAAQLKEANRTSEYKIVMTSKNFKK